MTQVKQLLVYQEKDSELLKIEQEISASDERKKFLQMQKFMKSASEKLDQLDAKSSGLLIRLDSLQAKYVEIESTLKDFDNLDELVDEGADLAFYQRKVAKIAEQLKALKAEINTLLATAKETTEEYQTLKKKVIETQKQIPEIEKAYKEYKNQRMSSAVGIREELEKLAATIDEGVLSKYKTKRSERIFPIICSIKNDRCSKCGIELSIADKDKVTAGGIVECENCHRFLYKD